MRRTLKLLLLLGIGLALMGKKDGDGVTPGDSDSTIDPTTGKPKTDEQRRQDSTYKGTNAQSDFKGVLDDADKESQVGRAEDSDGDGDPDVTSDSGLPSRSDLPPLNISSKQFGKKWGKHAEDYNHDPADPQGRQEFMDLANRVHDSPDDVRVGPYNPNGGGGPDYVFFRKGDDIVIMKPNGDFVTMFPKGEGQNFNQWYLDATPIQ
jgi:hypothetical protein